LRPRKLDGPPLEEIDSGGGKPCGPAAPDVATKGKPTFRSTPEAKLIVCGGVVLLSIEKSVVPKLKGPTETMVPEVQATAHALPLRSALRLPKVFTAAWTLGEAVESVPTPNIPDEVMLNGVAFGTKLGNPRVTFTGTVALTLPPFTFRFAPTPKSPLVLAVMLAPRQKGQPLVLPIPAVVLPLRLRSKRVGLALKLKALPVLHILWPLV